MELLATVLTTVEKALDRAEGVADRARSNGKIRIGP